jgi:hypothetical protein
MNSVQCPQCGWVSPASAPECPQCHSALSPPPGSALGAGNKTARFTHLFYRLYCVVMIFLNLCLIGAGIFMIISSVPGYYHAGAPANPRATLVGWFFIGMGIVLGVPFIMGLVLPRRPWTWVFGVVLMVCGMTSLFILPFAAVLMYFWFRPETQAYFGRTITKSSN